MELAVVEDARSPHLKYTRLHFVTYGFSIPLLFVCPAHIVLKYSRLAEIARIDSPYIHRMTKSIQKSVGRYDFGGIKWQYGFSMDGADAGVRFRSPPQVRRCCCLHPQITGHTPPLPFRSEMSSSAFSFPSELLSSFPAASDDVMTGECRILRFWHVECHSQKWKLCMDRMSDQNLWWHENQNYWMVTASREKRLVLIKSLTLCVLNALVGPQLTIYIYKYIFQGPKANSSRNQNINLWQEVFQEMIESTYHAESGLTAAPRGGWKLCWWEFSKADMSSSNGAMTSLLSVQLYARIIIIIALPASSFDNQ